MLEQTQGLRINSPFAAFSPSSSTLLTAYDKTGAPNLLKVRQMLL